VLGWSCFPEQLLPDVGPFLDAKPQLLTKAPSRAHPAKRMPSARYPDNPKRKGEKDMLTYLLAAVVVLVCGFGLWMWRGGPSRSVVQLLHDIENEPAKADQHR